MDDYRNAVYERLAREHDEALTRIIALALLLDERGGSYTFSKQALAELAPKIGYRIQLEDSVDAIDSDIITLSLVYERQN